MNFNLNVNHTHIKASIQNCFNKASHTYDHNCFIQKKICLDCLELLSADQNGFPFIADFACGTGMSTKMLTRKIPYKTCYAIDLSDQLIAQAKIKLQKMKEVICILSDFDKPIFSKNQLDLIFCNMGLQWSLSFSNTLALLNTYLKPAGTFLFSIPIQGTLQEIKQDYKNLMYPFEKIKQDLKQSGFNLIQYDIKQYRQHFKTHYAALRSIKNTGSNSLFFPMRHELVGLSRHHIKKIFINPKQLTLTYNIAFFEAQKQEKL